MEILKDYVFGDTTARYVTGSDGAVGLMLLPTDLVGQALDRSFTVDWLVGLQIVGDPYPGGSGGRSLRHGGTAAGLTFESQSDDEDSEARTVVTVLRTQHGCRVEHHLRGYPGEKSLDSFVVVRNEGSEPVTLELATSFTLTGMTPFGDHPSTPGPLVLHRMLSAWSGEGRLVSDRIEDLGLEPAWARWDHALRFGQVGSWPVHGFFPAAFVEDVEAGVCWGVQLAHPASWQIELGVLDGALSMSGGLADRELGHWTKNLAPGEELRTPMAYLTVTRGSVDETAHRLTSRHERFLDVPAVEEDLPVVFNEYCTTWGAPTPDNLRAIAERLRGKGIEYLVIDSGWYKNEGDEWYTGHGDWNVDRRTFPDGLDVALQPIRDAGMIPGIWFEFETVGSRSTAFTLADHLLRRDGVPITTATRRFWDFRDPFVVEHLSERVIEFLRAHGFGYLKVDYNNSIGIGCDGAESLGEGLRLQMAAVQDFFRRIREELPDLVIENCASGGHRLEPSMLALTSMSSFSDAHEPAEIPIIAANVQRAVLPRQNQIWAVVRTEDTPERLAYSLTATMLGRMCLSGDIHELSEAQWSLVDGGIEFYRRVAPVIKRGTSHRFGPAVTSYRNPDGWQAVRRTSDDGSQILVVAHTFESPAAGAVRVPLPDGGYEVTASYSHRETAVDLTGGVLTVGLDEPWVGAALLLSRIA